MLSFAICLIKWDESTPKVMNYLSQEKNTLSEFRNLLQARNYEEARSLLLWKQEGFRSPSKTFFQSVNLMQQLPEDVFAMCLVSEAKQLCPLKGTLLLYSEFLFLYYLATAFLYLATIFSLIVTKRLLGIFFNFEPWCKWNFSLQGHCCIKHYGHENKGNDQ